MAQVMTTCPTTGETVATGVEAEDRDELETMALSSMAYTCSACGAMHTWTADDARLERAG
jgi:hypothetical protein